MKNFYYFSNKNLKFVEIRNIKIKILILMTIFAFTTSSLLLAGYYLFFNNSTQVSVLNEENRELKGRLKETFALFDKLNQDVNGLSQQTQVLRTAADLPPVSDDESKLGVGGGVFEEIKSMTSSAENFDYNKISGYLSNIENKIKFQKSNYSLISRKLKSNQELYASVPALKPCPGDFSSTFGMRMHPILHTEKMHEGLDIIALPGTAVHAPGKGTIDFVGIKGGYGLCVEINHGFGYITLYGHLSQTYVKNGQKIDRGDIIAATGNSGLSTGPHLHYEVRHDGQALDPSEFMFDDLSIFDINKKQ
jgi:murein DD-endopeptidase MepM/ murein hydrolase activator NlpD